MEEYIYALFRTSCDPRVRRSESGEAMKLRTCVERFEVRPSRNKLVGNLGRLSPNPRVLPLREVCESPGLIPIAIVWADRQTAQRGQRLRGW